MNIKTLIKESIKKHSTEVIELNNFMADNPELSGKEFKAANEIVKMLKGKGFDNIEKPYAGMETAFKTSINKGKDRKAAILVEYDALPGIGHGCGHCASGSISILAALVLNDLRDYLNAQIDIIGTPDEEVMGGKIVMADKEIFKKYDLAIMIHMDNKNVITPQMLALDGLLFNFIGKAAHASAAPWEGRNALNAVQLFFHALDMMRQHVRPDVRIHGYIRDGGKSPNVIPEFTSAGIYTRSKERTYLDEISQWVKDCAKAAALATKTSVEVGELCPSLKDLSFNATGSKILEEIFNDLDLPLNDSIDELFGSSDIGHVDYQCPTFHPTISINKPYVVHTEEFAKSMKDESTYEAIRKGGEIISRFIIESFNNESIIDNIKKDYNKVRI